jgi:predicted GTPase
LANVDAEIVVTELKAAAIDVVTEEAAARGLPVVLADNELVPLEGDLDAEVLRLGEAVVAGEAVRS